MDKHSGESPTLLDMRCIRAGNVTELYLCKRELFYYPQTGNRSHDSIFPVDYKTAQQEAGFFNVPLMEM